MELDWLDEFARWAEATRSTESGAGLLAPGGDSGEFGSDFQKLSSGIWVPPSDEKVPADLMASYLTASDLGLEPATMPQVESMFARLPQFITVVSLAHVSCLMELRQSTNTELQADFLEHCCPQPLAELAEPRLTAPNVGFSSPQVALAAIELALTNCRDVEEDGSTLSVGPLLMAVGDHMVQKGERSREATDLEITRYGIFFAPRYVRSLPGRYDRMWREIAPTLSAHPDYVDVAATVEEATGIPFDEYISLGMGLYSVFSRKKSIMEGPWWMELSKQKLALAPATIERFFEQWSADAAWFSEKFGTTFSAWDFTAFQGRPLLRRADRILPFSVNFLLEKATSGIFYLVLDWLRDTGGDWQRWTRFVGTVWELYVRHLLEGLVGKDRLISEAALTAGWPEGKKIADNVLLYPIRWVLLETVAKRLNLATVATGGPEALVSDLQDAIVKKARQLADTVEVLKQNPELAGAAMDPFPGSFRPAVVLPGPFPVMPQVIKQVRRLVNDDPKCAALVGDGVEPLVILTADDLEALLGAANALGSSLDEQIEEWQSSNLAEMNAFIFLTEKHRRSFFAEWVDEASNTALTRSIGVLFGS